MSKFGYVSMLVGILMLMGYGLISILTEGSIPGIVKSAFAIIAIGLVMVLIKQVQERQKEKQEEEEYKDY